MQGNTRPRISKETAKADISGIIRQFGRAESPAEENRAAQLIMHTIRVLEERLENPSFVKKVYFEGPNHSKLLPEFVSEVARQYAYGEIAGLEAKAMLRKATRQYEKLFQEMGISLQESAALFRRR
ncbi:MAG: hypothetical protein ABSE71_00595 [Candidatus Micrarchaeaceae archaeon]|jgi:hypothetical protein|nr:hypothetical protein [Candidatus Micrarchaeota archaeon]